MSRRSFDESVRRALDSLPPGIARHLENVAIVVEEEDPDEPDLLGVFREEPYLPAEIAIFRRPLQESFPDPDELEREIRITVLHELGHYFGMEEGELDDLGYG
jgi:predicted Zn-dependent protease with MMP-like domain